MQQYECSKKSTVSRNKGRAGLSTGFCQKSGKVPKMGLI